METCCKAATAAVVFLDAIFYQPLVMSSVSDEKPRSSLHENRSTDTHVTSFRHFRSTNTPHGKFRDRDTLVIRFAGNNPTLALTDQQAIKSFVTMTNAIDLQTRYIVTAWSDLKYPVRRFTATELDRRKGRIDAVVKFLLDTDDVAITVYDTTAHITAMRSSRNWRDGDILILARHDKNEGCHN